jgi:hypothetical protein
MLKSIPLLTEARARQQELVATLRGLLEQAEAGHITEMVTMVVKKDNFRVIRCSSTLLEGLAYAAMMQDAFLGELKR